MSEKVTHNPNQFESLLKTPEQKALPDAAHAEKLRQGEADPARKARAVHEARKGVAETARADTQLNAIEQLEAAENTPQVATPTVINRELKRITLQRELQSIRRKLPKRERVLSSVIHQPVIRVVSEGMSRSVSRPSGLLGGGLVAFTGTTLYLYLAKHLGFTYNYLVFLILFAGGFAFGLILELAVYTATASRRARE